MTKFGILWYTDFRGIAYAQNNGIVVIPLFTNEKEAQSVSKIIQDWETRFIVVTFIEMPNGDYCFVCYQDPKTSYTKSNFGLYRSSMSQQGHYSQAKLEIQKNLPRIQIAYSLEPTNVSTYREISPIISIGKCRIILESDLTKKEYFYEKIAHQVSGGYKIE